VFCAERQFLPTSQVRLPYDLQLAYENGLISVCALSESICGIGAPLLPCRGMALDTAHHHPLCKLKSLTLVLVALLLSFWPQALSAQDAAQEVLNAINAARAENGLGPLAANALLNQAAQNHVNDMLTNYVYGHYGSDGSTVRTRVARTGYSATPWVSENWVSASSPSGAMRWWMNDYIHRVNILTARWTEVGIGVGTRGSEMIFVTVFSAGGGAGGEAAAVAAGAPAQEAPPPSVHIEQLSVPPEGLDYTVVGGDTLLAIGLRYGLPWERIAEANGLDERSLLQIGQTLHVPGSGPGKPPVPDVETEDYTVQPNDTLYSIAARRGMFWDEVAAVNGFGETTVLQIGQVIQVPVVEEESAPETTLVAGTQPATVGPVQPQAAPADVNSYSLMQFDPSKAPEVGPAQTMMASTGVGGPTSELTQVAMAKNEGVGATSAVLAAHAAEAEGALEATAPTAASASGSALYEVQPGDTIISIATKHDIAWGVLLALNGLDENSVLQLGQVIRLR
jgi:uncharacterized protein YkwD/spore germination protein YaaH